MVFPFLTIFRDECSKLRLQLNEQHREENRVSLEELTKMKDIQRDELRAELQSKIDALRKTVSILSLCVLASRQSAGMENINTSHCSVDVILSPHCESLILSSILLLLENCLTFA